VRKLQQVVLRPLWTLQHSKKCKSTSVDDIEKIEKDNETELLKQQVQMLREQIEMLKSQNELPISAGG
jgi:hypothetical protein